MCSMTSSSPRSGICTSSSVFGSGPAWRGRKSDQDLLREKIAEIVTGCLAEARQESLVERQMELVHARKKEPAGMHPGTSCWSNEPAPGPAGASPVALISSQNKIQLDFDSLARPTGDSRADPP